MAVIFFLRNRSQKYGPPVCLALESSCVFGRFRVVAQRLTNFVCGFFFLVAGFPPPLTGLLLFAVCFRTESLSREVARSSVWVQFPPPPPRPEFIHLPPPITPVPTVMRGSRIMPPAAWRLMSAFFLEFSFRLVLVFANATSSVLSLRCRLL